MTTNDEWFDEAINDAVEKVRLEAKKYRPGKVLPAVVPPSNPAVAKVASELMKSVASGKLAPLGTGVILPGGGLVGGSTIGKVRSHLPGGRTGRPAGAPDKFHWDNGFDAGYEQGRREGRAERVDRNELKPKIALKVILDEVKRDPSKAGEWITKVTNGIYQITREQEDE